MCATAREDERTAAACCGGQIACLLQVKEEDFLGLACKQDLNKVVR